MLWKDLSIDSKAILECMWDLNDRPRTFTMTIGETFKSVNNEYTFTEKVYEEIVKYHKLQENEGSIDAEWELSREGDIVTFKGGKWFKIENGIKTYYKED